LGQVSVRVELVGLVGLEWVLVVPELVRESAPVESELVQVDLGSVLELAEVASESGVLV
jgi:hypothetical protein